MSRQDPKGGATAGAKKGAARKVGPEGRPGAAGRAEVEAWFTEQAHPLEPELRQVRNVILGVDRRITESIKWKTPTFAFDGNIASFSPAKKLVSLMFHRGAEIPGDHPGLDGDGRLVRTMRFADLDEIQRREAELIAVINAWVRLKDGN